LGRLGQQIHAKAEYLDPNDLDEGKHQERDCQSCCHRAAPGKIPVQPSKFGLSSLILGSSQVDCWNHSTVAEDRAMIIGERLRVLREEKRFSQGVIEKRTGLLRCYISRVENGHTVPAVETLEKFARVPEVPMYQLFYEGEEPPKLPSLPKRKSTDDIAWGSEGKEARLLAKFCRLFSRMDEDELGMVLFMAQKMARRKAV
jgi:transcriptional regulator with XRE-family HTH domain